MPWLIASLDNQQPWYWLWRMNSSCLLWPFYCLSVSRKERKYLYFSKNEFSISRITYIYIYMCVCLSWCLKSLVTQLFDQWFIIQTNQKKTLKVRITSFVRGIHHQWCQWCRKHFYVMTSFCSDTFICDVAHQWLLQWLASWCFITLNSLGIHFCTYYNSKVVMSCEKCSNGLSKICIRAKWISCWIWIN